MIFNRQKFWDNYRAEFGRCTQSQVDAIELLLGEFEQTPKWSAVPLISYAFATIKHECANTFLPITEFGDKAYFTKYDGRASLGNTKKGDGFNFRGHGFLQLTGRRNFERADRHLHETGYLEATESLLKSPQMALEPMAAFEIMTAGMFGGWFTGKKLSDYITAKKKDYKNARRIINGTDKAALIAGYAEQFESILKNSISTPLPNARAASLIPANGNVETAGAPANADTVSEDTDHNEAAHDAAPPNSTTQTAENITNVDNSGDAAKIEAAKTAPVTEADTHSHTGFLAKVTAIIAAIATGQYAIPAFVQTDSFLASLIKFFEALFHGVFVLRYFVFGSIALWFVARKVEVLSTKIAAMRINSDPALGNIALTAPPPKPPLFERIFGVKI